MGDFALLVMGGQDCSSNVSNMDKPQFFPNQM